MTGDRIIIECKTDFSAEIEVKAVFEVVKLWHRRRD